MQSTETTKLLLQIDANTELLRRELATAAAATDQWSDKMERSGARGASALDKVSASAGGLDKAMSIAKGAVVGFLAAFTVDRIASLAAASLDYAGSIGETAQQLGVSTRALQIYSFAATQAGIEQATLETGLAKLTRTLGEAREGGKKQQEAFAAVGVTFKELAALTPDEAFRAVAEGLGKIEDPAKRAAIEVDLFGKAGQKLDTLLAGGIEGIDELARAADELGVVLSDEQIQKADETADKLAALKTVLSANIAKIVADNADAILKIADAVGVAAASIGTFIRMVEKADRLKGLVEKGDIRGIANFADNERLDDLNRRFPVGTQAARGGTQAVAAGGGGGRAASTPRTPRSPGRAAPAAGPTPAQLRAQEGDPAGFTTSAIADLDTMFARFKEVEAVAVDLSNVEIFDTESLKFGANLLEDASFSITDAILGAGSLGDALVDTFARAGAAILQSGLLNLLSGGTQGASFADAFSSIAGAFGGARANGGPVTGGLAYLVGERGPELMVPGASGAVIPNHALRFAGGGSGGGIVQQFDLRGAVVTEQLYAQMQAIGQQAATAGAVGGAAMARQDRGREARRRL